jgi:hypothetical protein
MPDKTMDQLKKEALDRLEEKRKEYEDRIHRELK